MNHKKYLLAAGLALAAAPFALANSVVVLGDSLSDVGQESGAKKAAYKEDGILTKLYVEDLGEKLGDIIQASTKKGTDYAYSGGVLDSTHKVDNQDDSANNRVLENQLKKYVEAGVKPDALHIVYGGANDLAEVLNAASKEKKPEDAQKKVYEGSETAASKTATLLGDLAKQGVKRVVIPTLPNVASTPKAFSGFGYATLTTLKAIKDKQEAAAKEGAGGDQGTGGGGAAGSGVPEDNQVSAIFEGFVKMTPGDGNLDEQRSAVLYKMAENLSKNNKQNTEETYARLKKAYEDFYKSATRATDLYNSAISSAIVSALNTKPQAEEVSPAAPATTGGEGGESRPQVVAQKAPAPPAAAGVEVVRVDINALFNDMITHPADYGFTNLITSVCTDSTTKDQCNVQGEEKIKEAASKLFADSFHPGKVAHQAASDLILATLDAPTELTVLRDAGRDAGSFARDFARNDGALRDDNRQAGTLNAVAGSMVSKTSKALSVGAKAQLNDNVQVAVTAGHEISAFNKGRVSVDVSTNSFTTSARYDSDNWWLGALFQINSSAYESKRAVQLASAKLVQTGKVSSSSVAVGGFAGYEWNLDTLKVAALADLTLLKGSVPGFAEKGRVAKIHIQAQDFNAITTGIGARLSYSAGAWHPFASIRLARNWKSDTKAIKATLYQASFSGEKATFKAGEVDAQIGLRYHLNSSPWQASLSAGSKIANDNKRFNAQFGFDYRF